MDERKAFSAWWASRPVTVLNAHEGLALMVWQAATAAERERAAKVCQDAKPAGGRMWTDEQAACFDCLSHVEEVIRKG